MICFMFYYIVGAMGYFTFFERSNANILESYDNQDLDWTFSNVTRIGLTLAISFSYPLMMFPLRGSLDDLACVVPLAWQ